MQKLVSMLTPAYQNGHLIHRLLDSVLTQTYQNIEMFVIDDGSTDNTKEIVLSYIEKFANVGKKLQYFYQENGGQSVAINNGLKLINGDYFVWPDADDWYAESKSLEIMVEALENSSDYVSCCRCMSYYVEEETLDIKTKTLFNDKKKLFEDCLLNQNNFFWGAGNYMTKTHVLLNNINKRTIYTEKAAGQNWQLLLPVLYNYECITINKYLFKILERKNSHSRIKSTYKKEINKYKSYFNTLLDTINGIKEMTNDNKEKYIGLLAKKYNKYYFLSAFNFKQKKDCRIYYNEMLLKNINEAKKHKLQYRFSQLPCGFLIYKLFVLPKRIICKILRIIKGIK